MPKLRIDGDASGGIKSVELLHKAQDKLTKGGKEVEEQWVKLGGSLSAAARKAQTDWQKYNGEVQKLSILVKKGIIDQKTADQAAQKYYKTIFKGAIEAKQAIKEELAARHAATQALKQEEEQRKKNISAAIRFHGIAKSERAGIDAKKKSIRDLADATARAAREQRELENAHKKSFGPMAVGQLTAYAASFVGIQQAAALVRGELEAIKQLEEKKAQSQLSTVQADELLRQNIFSLPKAERDKLLSGADQIASDRKLPQAGIKSAVASTISAVGNADLTLDLVNTGAKFTRDINALSDFAGGLGDIVTTGAAKNAKDALGFLTITASEARITDPAQTARQLGKVVAAYTVSTAGSSAEEGASLFAALTKGGADPKGETTRTGAIQLIDKSLEFFKKNADSLKLKEDQYDTFTERRELLFGDKNLAKQFLSEVKFESGVQGAIGKLFLGEGGTREAFENTLQKLGNSSSRSAAADEAFKFIGEGRLQRTRRTEDAISSAFEKYALSSDPSLTDENSKKLVSLVARANREPERSVNYRTFLEYGTTFDRSEAITEIQSALNQPNLIGQTEDQANAVDALRDLLKELKDLNAEVKKKPKVVGRQRAQ